MKKSYQELTLLEFQKRFSDEQSCLEYVIKMRWPEGFVCPVCKHKGGWWKPSRKLFECSSCHKTTSATSGTMFHKTHLPLLTWFWCIYLMSTFKKGVAALYIQKQLGIGTYRAAWMMTHKIRKAMKDRDEKYKLSGIVQTDEIWIGGKQSLEDRKQQGENKTPFLIAVDEQDNGGPRFLTFEEVESIYEDHVIPAIEKNIEKGSTLKTDGAGAYIKAEEKGYGHQRTVGKKDKEKNYENLKWVNLITSNLKRYLLSTHHGVFPRYRKSFLSEFAYRFNRRFWPHQAFDRLLFANIFGELTTLQALKA